MGTINRMKNELKRSRQDRALTMSLYDASPQLREDLFAALRRS